MQLWCHFNCACQNEDHRYYICCIGHFWWRDLQPDFKEDLYDFALLYIRGSSRSVSVSRMSRMSFSSFSFWLGVWLLLQRVGLFVCCLLVLGCLLSACCVFHCFVGTWFWQLMYYFVSFVGLDKKIVVDGTTLGSIGIPQMGLF